MEKKNSESYCNGGISRRKFIGSSSAIFGGGVLLSSLPIGASAYVAGSDVLKVALVGSGSRGTGAVVNALRADNATELVAIADIFREKVDNCYNLLMANDSISNRVNVTEENRLVGLNAYEKAIEMADVVILATPPAFRPLHFETAVNAGKHVFMEKPLSTDAPGARRILSSGREAEKKGLCVVVGLQNRYSVRIHKFKEMIDNGIIGKITSMSCNYLIGGVSLVARQPGDSELVYQLRNWRYFEWLWGGSPAGLTIHYEDIHHWLKGSYPVRAFGLGGRSALSGLEHGDTFDNHYIEYEYEDGIRLHSRTRTIRGCWSDRRIVIGGSKGEGTIHGWRDSEIRDLQGNTLWQYDDSDDPSPFQIEHDEFFKAIRTGNLINDTEWAGMSNMTCMMGRMAVQSGQLIEWDDAYQSDLVLVPDDLNYDSEPPTKPMADGTYPVHIPGSGSKVL